MKIICIGRNYSDHISELGNDTPAEPVIFLKPKSSLAKPQTRLYYPFHTIDWQYELEVVIKISKNGRSIAIEDAPEFYDQYSVGLDMTARDLQQKLKAKGLPWELAKSHDSSAAVGQFVDIPYGQDMSDIHFYLEKNGEVVQEGITADMIFSIDYLVSYISQYFTLNIGDIIFTGTPAGVGAVDPGDILTGYLEGEQLFDVEIY